MSHDVTVVFEMSMEKLQCREYDSYFMMEAVDARRNENFMTHFPLTVLKYSEIYTEHRTYQYSGKSHLSDHH